MGARASANGGQFGRELLRHRRTSARISTTTPPLRFAPRCARRWSRRLGCDGNPSSVHDEGRATRALRSSPRGSRWRRSSARAPEDVIFTSGGTEANALALAAQPGEAWHCYMSAVEHPSVLAGGRFYRETTTRIPVIGRWRCRPRRLASELAKHHLGGWRPFVSLMAANNETGAIQPVAEAAEIVHAAGGLLHSDAVQVAGRLPLDIGDARRRHDERCRPTRSAARRASALSCFAQGVSVEPLLKGGGQERRRRAGTENVAGIVGFGVAAELAAADLAKTAAIGALARRVGASGSRRSRRTRWCCRAASRGSPIRAASRFPAPRPRRWSLGSILRASR